MTFPLHNAFGVAKAAGEIIMQYYGTDVPVELKDDESPVTFVDKLANDCICSALAELYPDVPLLSEEGDMPSFRERSQWKRYFLIDPLDGTRGFIRRTGDFTVNIALMERNRPVAGVIYAPTRNALYWGGKVHGSYKQQDSGEGVSIAVASELPDSGPVVLQSHVDRTPRLDKLFCDTPHTRMRAGSSLKFCLIAEGSAHVFPCLHPTWEWDTAAGQAILEGAGGFITGFEGEPFRYGKRTPLNGWFIARAQ